jgi:hypothetical protein
VTGATVCCAGNDAGGVKGPRQARAEQGSSCLQTEDIARAESSLSLSQRKFGVVLDEIRPSAAPELQAVRTFAEYLASDTRR